jgi:hypothetical protein
MNTEAAFSSVYIPSTSRFDIDTGNKFLQIIPPVTHSRLLDKARCVGASMKLGPYNGRTLPQVVGSLGLLVKFVFLLSVNIFKSQVCVCVCVRERERNFVL